MKRLFLAPVIGALVFATATPALAQRGRGANRQPSYGYGPNVEARRVGYDNGFREGLKEGEKDGRKGDRYQIQDERDFQRADHGYKKGYGNVDLYRQAFRAGFADGYADGYGRFSRGYGNGRNGNGRYGNGRNGDGGYGNGGYGTYDPRYGGNGQRPGSYSIAHENGARDGLEKGREDMRKNRSFDPRRHEWYREGDRHYESRYGSRDQYKDEYRRGFNAGYDQGFRDGRYR